MFSSSVYYAQYILAPGRVDFETMDEAAIGGVIGGTISTYMGFISVGALISMMVLMPIFLKVFKTGYKSLIVSQVLTVACYAILFFTGKLNFMYCCILSFVATVVGAMVNALVNVLVNDTIDFIMLKEGKQLNGVVSSVKGFAQKCGTTIVNSGMLAVLALCGFDAQLGPFGQSDTAIAGTNAVRFLIPALVSLAIIIIMVFYPLKKYFPAIAEMKAKMKADMSEKAAPAETEE
jgi:Na+/melibiose symporter-like transporter